MFALLTLAVALSPAPSIRAEIEAGQARIVRATPSDIGSPLDALDGKRATLYRTPAINPAEIVLAFERPKTTDFFGLFVHMRSAFRIEAADSVEELDGRGRSYRDLTGERQTNAEGVAFVELAEPVTARVFRLWTRRLEGDDYVHIYEWRFDRPERPASLRVEMIPARPEWKPFDRVATEGVVRVRAYAGTGEDEIDVTEKATWSAVGFRRWPAGGFDAWIADRVEGGSRPGRIAASYQGLTGAKEFTIEAYEKVNTRPDVDVLFIEKTPRRDYDAPDLGNGPGWPREGAPITWKAWVQSHNREARAVPFEWAVGGQVVRRGTIPVLPRGQRVAVELTRPWRQKGEELTFRIQAPAWDANDGNNARTIRTNALSLGVWVERKMWDHWHDHQHRQNPRNESFEDWIQFVVDEWNAMMAEARFPQISPNGLSDRIRVDKVTIVPTGALPLAGGLPSNNPDRRDKTVDLAWGFNVDPNHQIGEYWIPRPHDKPVREGPPAFLLDLALIHELHHARYHIDSYGFDVHSPGIDVTVAGKPLVGGWLPEKFMRPRKYDGMMASDYRFIDIYTAGVWERVAGRRARGGNMNSPSVIGEWLETDVPARSRFRFLLPDGRPAAGAELLIWHARPREGDWYGKTYTGEPDRRLRLGDDGEIAFEGLPYPKPIRHTYGHANTVNLCVVRHRDRIYVHFMEISDFHLAYWRGQRQLARFEVKLVDPPAWSN